LGKLWAETTNETLPENGFRMDQKTTQRGATDYISDSHGKQHSVRRWDGNEYKYTRFWENLR
jgi:hypothetical protein